jgi:hypothetical protein
LTDHLPEKETSSVICKNPLCMRIFTVSSAVVPKGTAKARLACPGCRHENDYRRDDFHRASGPEGVALNPV